VFKGIVEPLAITSMDCGGNVAIFSTYVLVLPISTRLRLICRVLAGDCPRKRGSTALHNRCAIYYPYLPALLLLSKDAWSLTSRTP